ncbi:hypothetical protein DL769_004654 [Monosporascus sp. CRB-8-3]|nr:hypothetical protein DL769_004654 [Monosporascus sp. CRB-8-3]
MYNQGKIMRRLLGRPATDSSSNDSSPGIVGYHSSQTYRPNASQNAVYPAGVPIACIDKSADGQTAVLGGRHILKIVQFDGLNIKEGIDVRALITSQYAGKSNAASSTSEQLSIKDVKLASSHASDPRIFTACASGKIFAYDINRLGSTTGLEYIQTREDSRQVNKLDFNPHRGTWLLSGGQDGVIRCFDVKTPIVGRNGPTFRTFQALRCNAEGIRDLKWSPKDGMVFACATESGVILKWDIRKNNAPLLKINAHDTQKGASSISWHPDGEHLISAGLDSKCHVWDLSGKAEKRQKPKWTINAPAPVTVVSWRPGLWSATAQGRRAAQVAVSYDEGGNHKRYGIDSVHIWDLARPTMPYKEVDLFESSPSTLLWHDQDLLWTAGSDGLFTQCDVAFAPKVIDRQPLSNLDFSSRGDVLMFLEERPGPPRPRPLVPHEKLPIAYSSSPSGQMLSISRSDSEEDVLGSFLGPKRRPSRKRQAGSRSAHGLSTTPPSGPGIGDQILSLEQAMKLTGPFKPQQVMAIGHVPAAPKMHFYQYLSNQYLEILHRELPHSEGEKLLNERVADIMEQYAQAAENVSQFRLAQTWRILSYTTSFLLARRSQFHLEKRLTPQLNKKSPTSRDRLEARATLQKRDASPYLRVSGEETPRKPPSISSTDSRPAHGKSLLAEEIDSESQVPTPLARPVSDTGAHGIHAPEHKLTPVQEMDSFKLPPSIYPESSGPRKRLDSAPLSIASHDSQVSWTEGYDFFDVEAAEALSKAIDVPKKKESLSLDYIETRSPSTRKTMNRHDSDESFAQMFSLSDSSRQASLLASSSNGSGRQAALRGQLSRDNSNTIEEEYESRIRGHQIGMSPEQARYSRQDLQRHDSDILKDDILISQTTTDTFDSEPSRVEGDRSPVRLQVTSPLSPSTVSREHPLARRPEEHTSPTITETDYLPWPDDPPYPHPLLSDANPKRLSPPINPYEVISKALTFETRHSALNASAIILLLKPLVPDDVIDPHQAAAILRQHHNRLVSLKLFVEAALLRNLCVRGWPNGMEFWGDNYTSVFATAQERQRISVAFTCPQCHKPREVDHAAAANGESSGIWKCENCRAAMAPCAVCGHRDMTPSLLAPAPTPVTGSLLAKTKASDQNDEPYGDLILSTWWYCPGCSHGGHATCLEGWHAPIPSPPPTNMEHPRQPPQQQNDFAASSRPPSPSQTMNFPDIMYPETYSDGCCPFDGCGHACLPGRWRNESSTARIEELGRVVRDQTRGTVGTTVPDAGVGVGGGSAGAGPTNPKGGERRFSSAAETTAPPAPALFIASASGGVRGDTIEVPQSRAVEHVRELGLAAAGGGGSGGSGYEMDRDKERERERPGSGIFGIPGSSPGRASGSGGLGGSSAETGGTSSGGGVGGGAGRASSDRERRKSVKFAGT